MTHPAELQAATHDVADAFEANEFYQEQGWTDGLPIVPPTAERVAAFLEAAGLHADDVVGVEGVRQRPLTAEKVAINAVMAGCRPDYMPVVVAVLRAMCQERFNMHGSTASTGGSAPFIVVNGPVCGAIGMNATHNVLANGNRANATIGRTVRLVLINLLGCAARPARPLDPWASGQVRLLYRRGRGGQSVAAAGAGARRSRPAHPRSPSCRWRRRARS